MTARTPSRLPRIVISYAHKHHVYQVMGSSGRGDAGTVPDRRVLGRSDPIVCGAIREFSMGQVGVTQTFGSFQSGTRQYADQRVHRFPEALGWASERIAIKLGWNATASLVPLSELVFDRWAAGALSRIPAVDIVHCFEGSALRTLRAAKRRGAVTVLDVPSVHELYWSIMIERAVVNGSRVPRPRLTQRQNWIDGERMEADFILAPSRFVIKHLRHAGVPQSKILLLPYGVDAEKFRPADRPDNGRPFRVLYVGRVSFQKRSRVSLWRHGEH